MKSCENCIYEEDKKEIKSKGYIFWSSSKPHPCISCERCYSLPIDNFIAKEKGNQ